MPVDKPKPIGYIKNLPDCGMCHLVYPGAQLSFAFPIGHVYEMIVDGEVPSKEFKEEDLKALIEPDVSVIWHLLKGEGKRYHP